MYEKVCLSLNCPTKGWTPAKKYWGYTMLCSELLFLLSTCHCLVERWMNFGGFSPLSQVFVVATERLKYNYYLNIENKWLSGKTVQRWLPDVTNLSQAIRWMKGFFPRQPGSGILKYRCPKWICPTITALFCPVLNFKICNSYINFETL